MKTHFFWYIYVITIICAGGWYVLEQKDTIAEQKKVIQSQEKTIYEFSASQNLPALKAEKRKVKVVEKPINVEEVCKDLINQYTDLSKKAVQCAYELKFCRESSDIYNNMLNNKEKNGQGEN